MVSRVGTFMDGAQDPCSRRGSSTSETSEEVAEGHARVRKRGVRKYREMPTAEERMGRHI